MRSIELKSGSALIITDYIDRKYFSGVDIAEGVLVLYQSGGAYFTDLRYFSAAKPLIENNGMTAIKYFGIDSLGGFIKEKGFSSLGVDYSNATVKEYNEYKTLGIEIFDCSNLIDVKKAVKDEIELSLIVKACAIVQKAYHTAIKEVKEGVTELELKDRIESLIVEFGAIGPSFETIVAFGANGAVPHHVTGKTKLQKNMPILIDVGANVDGYFSDLTRTCYFGVPSKKFIDCYNAVLLANVKAEEEIRAGMTTDKADAVAREYLKGKNLDGYFTHSLGHGVGTRIHEYPTLSPKKSTALEEGTVFTVEPGVYFDGEFGIRIEDTVVIDGGKVKRLFTDSKELMIL